MSSASLDRVKRWQQGNSNCLDMGHTVDFFIQILACCISSFFGSKTSKCSCKRLMTTEVSSIESQGIVAKLVHVNLLNIFFQVTRSCRKRRGDAYLQRNERWRKPLCLGFVILFCLRTILRKASARSRLAYAKIHGQTLASASLTRTVSSMMLLNVNLASASLPRRLV